MKANRFIHWFIAFLVCGAIHANATVFSEIAGDYAGWRVQTTPNGTTLFLEFDEVRLDGSLRTLLVDENGRAYLTFTVLTFDADGNIAGPQADVLEINGRSLSIDYRSEENNVEVKALANRMD
jgi:hypothetical protein